MLLAKELVDLERFELSTSSMPWKRAPNCATGPHEAKYVLRIAQAYCPELFKKVLSFFLRFSIDGGGREGAQSNGRRLQRCCSRDRPTFPKNRMNNAVSQVSLETSPSGDERENRFRSGVHPRSIDDLAHALRQPLSTIESLAFYLELTSENDQICRHLRQIRLMVDRASNILEEASA